MSSLAKLLSIAAVSALVGPVAAEPAPNALEPQTECPPMIRGVKVTVEQVPEGVVLEFTTPHKQHLQDLQLLLREAGALVEYHSKVAMLDEHPKITRDGKPIPPVDIAVKGVANGVRVTVRAEEARNAAAVQEQARSFKQFWDKNRCVNGLAESPASSPLVKRP